MNYFDFTQDLKYPLESERLDEMQAAWSAAGYALAGLAGNNVVISGMLDTGTNITQGYLIFNGELMEFRQSAKAAYVKLFVETRTRTIDDETYEVSSIRYMQCVNAVSTGDEYVLLSDLKYATFNTTTNRAKIIDEFDIDYSKNSGLAALAKMNVKGVRENYVSISGYVFFIGGNDGTFTLPVPELNFVPKDFFATFISEDTTVPFNSYVTISVSNGAMTFKIPSPYTSIRCKVGVNIIAQIQ